LGTWLHEHPGERVSSELLRVEAMRAARRHSSIAAVEARSRLAGVIIVSVTTSICERAAELGREVLRSVDAVHVATALSLGDDLEAVLTYDATMTQAAEAHGLRVLAPGA
jgi:hypothetical protein